MRDGPKLAICNSITSTIAINVKTIQCIYPSSFIYNGLHATDRMSLISELDDTFLTRQ